jgi:hypothetical protein
LEQNKKDHYNHTPQMLYGDLKGVLNRNFLEQRPPPPLGTKQKRPL